MYWVNGVKSKEISPSDRSFNYGDGCFTTALVINGVLQEWPLHLARFNSSLKRLRISPPDWSQIEGWIAHSINDYQYQSGLCHRLGVKIHISRGDGGRGYNPIQVVGPQVTISTFPYPQIYQQYQKEGIQLGICEQRLGLNPMLAGMKHNNRIEQVLLKAELEEIGYTDGITFDIHNHVIETTSANLFWFKNGQWYTPSLELAGVAGVMRQKVLNTLTQQQISIGNFDCKHLLEAEEIFITNALMEVVPVTQIAHHYFVIGKRTRQLQEQLVTC